jgi:hypothetical protein
MRTFNEFINESYSINESDLLQNQADFLRKEEKHFASFLKPKRLNIEINNDILTVSPASGSFTITVDGKNHTIDSTGKPSHPESVSYIEIIEYLKRRTQFKVLNEAFAANNQVIDIVKEIALNIFGEKAITMIDQDMIEISTAATSKSNVDKFTKEVEETLNKTRSAFDIEIDEKEKSVKIYA